MLCLHVRATTCRAPHTFGVKGQVGARQEDGTHPWCEGSPKHLLASSCMHTQIFNLCVHARKCVTCAPLLAVSRTRAPYTNPWLCSKDARRCTSKLCLLRLVKQSVCCCASNLCPKGTECCACPFLPLHTEGVWGTAATCPVVARTLHKSKICVARNPMQEGARKRAHTPQISDL